ncbi:hypothetical protein EIO60_03946|nr:hypothetical protein [Candidatus Pantoea persica]
MLSSQIVSQTIARNWLDLYETIWKLDYFAKWALGLSSSTLEQEGSSWRARSGRCGQVRFTPHNPFSVMDHWIDSGFGKEVYMPMRVIANEQGAEIIMVVYRQPLMSNE